MLYDRDYMRDGDRSRWRSPVVALLVVLSVVFLAECFLQGVWHASLGSYLGLSYRGVARHEYWRIFTYSFLHSAPLPFHLLFNGLALWFFGRSIVEGLGVVKFWQIYLGAGLVGAVFELANQAWNGNYAASWTVGASACVLGLVAVFCVLAPSEEMTFFLYFFPVRMKAMTLFWILLGFSVFGTIFPNGGVAHAAHLGGLLAGVAYVRLFLHGTAREWLQQCSQRWLPRKQPRPVSVPVAAVGARATARRSSPGRVDPETPEDFMKREVDPILDKISAHGLQSLTDRERRILERARDRMKQRP